MTYDRDFEVAYNTGEVRRFVASDTDHAQEFAKCMAPPMAVQWKLFGITHIATGSLLPLTERATMEQK